MDGRYWTENLGKQIWLHAVQHSASLPESLGAHKSPQLSGLEPVSLQYLMDEGVCFVTLFMPARLLSLFWGLNVKNSGVSQSGLLLCCCFKSVLLFGRLFSEAFSCRITRERGQTLLVCSINRSGLL